jgi:hypothetical protein
MMARRFIWQYLRKPCSASDRVMTPGRNELARFIGSQVDGGVSRPSTSFGEIGKSVAVGLQVTSTASASSIRAPQALVDRM